MVEGIDAKSRPQVSFKKREMDKGMGVRPIISIQAQTTTTFCYWVTFLNPSFFFSLFTPPQIE